MTEAVQQLAAAFLLAFFLTLFLARAWLFLYPLIWQVMNRDIDRLVMEAAFR